MTLLVESTANFGSGKATLIAARKLHAYRKPTGRGALTECGKRLDQYRLIEAADPSAVTCATCAGKVDSERTAIFGGNAA